MAVGARAAFRDRRKQTERCTYQNIRSGMKTRVSISISSLIPTEARRTQPTRLIRFARSLQRPPTGNASLVETRCYFKRESDRRVTHYESFVETCKYVTPRSYHPDATITDVQTKRTFVYSNPTYWGAVVPPKTAWVIRYAAAECPL